MWKLMNWNRFRIQWSLSDMGLAADPDTGLLVNLPNLPNAKLAKRKQASGQLAKRIELHQVFSCLTVMPISSAFFCHNPFFWLVSLRTF